MPQSLTPDDAARWAKTVADIYAQAQTDLTQTVAARLARGITEPGWAERKLAEITVLRREAQRLVADIETKGAKAAIGAMRTAYEHGSVVAGGPKLPASMTATAERAVLTIAGDLVGALGATHDRILRSAQDMYRQAIADTITQVTAGTATVRQAAARAMARLAAGGITGFEDSRGRNWQLDTYTEMAARTGAARAAIQGAQDRWQADGRDLVIVSDAPEECELCRPLEGKVLSLSGDTPEGADVGGGFTVWGSLGKARAAGLFHPQCFPGDVVVSSGSPIRASDRRRYDGELVVIHTASGHELPVTPNHPVLTPEGWVAAGALCVGQRVLSHRSDIERVDDGVGPHQELIETRIGDVHETLRQASPMPPVRVPASAEQFHGDGAGGDVDVVLADGELLRHVIEINAAKRVRQAALVRSGGRLGLAPADLRTPKLDPSVNGGLVDAEAGRELVLALTGLVTADEIVDIGRRQFSGHVYNLQTGSGWYQAAGICVSNCRHGLGAFVPGLTEPMHNTEDPQGDADRQRQRTLERRVRESKRAVGAAEPFGDQRTLDRAKGVLKERQAALGEFVREHDRKAWVSRQRTRIQRSDAGPPPAPAPQRPPPPPSHEYVTRDLGLTDEERDAIEFYTDDSTPINSALRAGKVHPDDQHNVVDKIDAVLDRHRLPEDASALRGASPEAFGVTNPADVANLVGRDFSDPAYLSTTLRDALPSTFSRPSDVMLRMHVTAGTPAAYIGPVSEHPSERELLLGRGLRMLIVGASYDENAGHSGMWVVDVVVTEARGGLK